MKKVSPGGTSTLPPPAPPIAPSRPPKVRDHSSQGASLDKASFRLAESEFSPSGYSYQVPNTSVEVIVPSMSLDMDLSETEEDHNFEERGLWNLVKNGPTEDGRPPVRQAMVMSSPFHPGILEYVVQLLAGIPMSQAKDRLLLFLKDPSSGSALTGKLLERPEILERLKNTFDDGSDAHLLCYISTDNEQTLADRLGIPLRANDPKLKYWGSKQGSRAAFEEAGVPFPPGIPEKRTVHDLAQGIAELAQQHPESTKLVVKLGDGVSGDGNAMMDLDPLRKNPPKTPQEWANRVEAMLPEMRFQGASITWELFQTKIPELGVIAELFVDGKSKTSPSVQGRVNEDGSVEVLSTHEQVLGGPDGQVFLGSSFPAKDAYRTQLHEYGRKVGEVLAEKGARGRYAVDFIAAEKTGSDGKTETDVRAIEINLREGGTTHPYEILRILTRGQIDSDTGLFHAADGTPKYYVMSDGLQDDRFKGLTPSDAADIALRNELHFDPETGTGIAFHMLSNLRNKGMVGVTCVADSEEDAQALYRRTQEALKSEVPEEYILDESEGPSPTLETDPSQLAPLFLVGEEQVLLRPSDGNFSDWIRSGAFSPDGARIAVAVNKRGDYSLRLHDASTGKQERILEGPTLPIRQVAFGGKGQVAAAGADGLIYVWDTEEGHRLWNGRTEGMVDALAFNDDGRYLATGDTRGDFAIWDATDGKKLLDLPGDRDNLGWARSVALTRDGHLAAVGYGNGTVKLLSVPGGEQLAELKGHSRGAQELTFSEDGLHLAVSDGTGDLSVWQVEDGVLLCRLERDWMTGKPAFSPDGERIAFGSSDGSVHVYDWQRGAELNVRNFDATPTSLVQDFQMGPVRWSGGGQTLSTASANGTLHAWTFA